MTRTDKPVDCCEMQALILRALVRKLVAKDVLSSEDVQALLSDAVKGLDIVVHGKVVPDAANEIIIKGDQVPAR